MFSGIVTHIGTVDRIEKTNGNWRLFVRSDIDTDTVDIGASISNSGCCLTVVEKGEGLMAFDVSGETISKTIIVDWEDGTRLNLERSLKLGDEIGGHMVSGHVDGLATLKSVTPDGDSYRLKIEVPEELALFIAPKGCVALDGISLTVNEVERNVFGVNIIPHTWTHTTIGDKKPGDHFNLEIDMTARYIARIMGKL